MYQTLHNWAVHRHATKSPHWIMGKYWLIDQGGGWRFAARSGKAIRKISRHKETPIKRHIKVQNNRSPYDGDWVYWSTRMGTHPESVKLNIVGESLFNDGVGVVVFATIYRIVVNGSDGISAGAIGLAFLEEAGGGLLFGLSLGYGLYRLLRSINHYQTEVLVTVAGVMGGYLLAQQLHISGPLAMVVAGLFVGDHAREHAMSKQTEDYIDKFWELIDSILNSLLFVLIGLELLRVDFKMGYWFICLLAIGLVLLGRFVAIWVPYRLARPWLDLDSNAPIMLTWGGLRGGISIALALSIPDTLPQKDVLVAITYAVVLFSVIVQGLTMERLIRRLYPTC